MQLPNENTGDFIQFHQAFICEVGENIAKIDKVIRVVSVQEMNEMLDQIRETGDRTATKTKSGQNHPCQTATLRCDHQGCTSGGLINTQIQIGGSEERAERKDSSKESTSINQVNVQSECYLHSSIKSVLASAHDHSWRIRKVLILTAKAKAVVNNSTQYGKPRYFHCIECNASYGPVMSHAELGLDTGSYPPRCIKKSGSKTCNGSLTES